ncbi:hypothetical protein M3Y99_00075000 [Aphelenchoides fujianensis]|nr:hypothetical protein M3Y99_00075000 [Aphelenchoides fujianensis]
MCSHFNGGVAGVLQEVQRKGEPSGQVSMFMSGLGLLDLFLNFIPTAILVTTGVDRIDWAAVPWAALAGMYNFLVNFGIALLSPLVISIGMLVGIPLSAAIDIVFRSMDITLTFVIGALLIICSFVLSTLPLREVLTKKCGREGGKCRH